MKLKHHKNIVDKQMECLQLIQLHKTTRLMLHLCDFYLKKLFSHPVKTATEKPMEANEKTQITCLKKKSISNPRT